MTLSLGLSISCLMAIGLMANNIMIFIGIPRPLDRFPLLVVINIISLLLTLVTSPNFFFKFDLNRIYLNLADEIPVLFFFIFPIFAIIGTFCLNIYADNKLILILIILIATYILYLIYYKTNVSESQYLISILSISISLLLLLGLRSNHIIGADSHLEYFYFISTLSNGYWKIMEPHSLMDACISISVLPTIFCNITSIEKELLFKIFYCLIFAFYPVLIFKISKISLSNPYAFLASIYSMSQAIFLLTASNARTSLALFFVALSFMVYFDNFLRDINKKILIIIFISSCILTHYSTSYIFLFLTIVFNVTNIFLRFFKIKIHQFAPIGLYTSLLFFAAIFAWYSQITDSAFSMSTQFIYNTISELDRLFIMDSRGYAAEALSGQTLSENNYPQIIEFAFTWLGFIFIAIGFIFYLFNFRNIKVLSNVFGIYVKNFDYFLFALINIILLTCMLAIPYLAVGYAVGRTFELANIILSGFFIIGGIKISNFFYFSLHQTRSLNKIEHKYLGKSLILLVLLPLFFSVTGLTYQICGIDKMITLNSGGDQFNISYIYDSESQSSKWLIKNVNHNFKNIYSDIIGYRILLSQSGITQIEAIMKLDKNSIFLHKRLNNNSYIFLREGNFINSSFKFEDVSFITKPDLCQGIIYDSGKSKIWRTV